MTWGEVLAYCVVGPGGVVALLTAFWVNNKKANRDVAKDEEKTAVEVEEARLAQSRETQLQRQSAFDYMEGKLRAINEELETRYKTHFEEQRTEIQEQRGEIQDIRTTSKRMEKSLDSTRSENTRLRETVTTLRELVAKIENEYKAKIEVLESDHELLIEKHENEVARRVQVEDECASLRDECSELRARVKELEKVQVKVLSHVDIQDPNLPLQGGPTSESH